MVMSTLRGERAAQVTLTSTLGVTRSKTFRHAVRVLTRRPRMRGRQAFGEEDSYKHLLRYYRREGHGTKDSSGQTGHCKTHVS